MLLLALLLVLFGVFYWFCTSTFGYWKDRGVPYENPRFFIGNMAKIFQQKLSLGGLYHEFYDKFKDYKYVGFYKCRQPCIIIRDLDLAKHVMIENFKTYHDNEMMVGQDADPLFGRNPFVLRGDEWKNTRGHLTSSFTAAKVKTVYPMIEQNCKVVENNLLKNPNKGKEVDARDFCRKYTLDNTASAVFGLDGDAIVNEDSKMFKIASTLIQQSFFQGIKEFCVLVFPSLGTLLKMEFFPKPVTKFIIGLTEDTINYRTKNNIIRQDFLQMMLEKKDKSEFQDIDLAAHCAGFFIDGVETSSTVMSYALYEIAANPLVQKKLREEIKATMAKNEGKITFDVLNDMKYLEMVFSECVRKNPPLPFYARVCQEKSIIPPADYKSTKDVTLEVGTTVIVPVYAIHYDSNYYPDPQKFDPERFSAENIQNIPKCAYMPFGEGPRLCLGKRYGLVQVKMGIIAAITNFELRINSKTKVPLVIDPKTFMVAPIGGIWLDFHPIKE